MQLYIARHGRTNYNDLGLCNADPEVDVHLSQIGIAQAEDVAKSLKSITLDHIFVSELRRTLQTAEIINMFHHTEIKVDPRLNDGRSGFEGKSFKEYDSALNNADNRWEAHFNGGESIEDIKARVTNFIRELQPKNYKQVLIVTSDWVMRVLFASVLHLSNEEVWTIEIKQGSYLELYI
jgi:broad specificity phosphatase PhoE